MHIIALYSLFKHKKILRISWKKKWLREVGMVTSALWSDVDGDGWCDLLLTLEWGPVRYFHNNQGRRFEDWSEKAGFAAAGTGWWNSIATADFNGDGRPDYAVGNLGLNTQYHADPAHPALLFAGDFNGDGSSQLIEAYYEGEKLFPWRTRKDLGAAIPAIMKRYARNDFFARPHLAKLSRKPNWPPPIASRRRNSGAGCF